MGCKKNILLFRLLAVSIILGFITSTISGQKGSPLLTHYRESREIENQNWAISQDENNLMLFVNRRGLLAFDGQTWNLVRLPLIPYTIRFNTSISTTFIGGEGGYGYIERDNKGFYQYHSLSVDSISPGAVTDIKISGSQVYFYGEKNISRFNLESGRNDLFLGNRDNKPFRGMFVTPENVFINVYGEGLFRLESDTLFPVVTGYLLQDIKVLFSLPYNNTSVLLGLDDGRLTLFDGIRFQDYQIKDEGYLRQNILSEGIEINDSLYAFSTLDGGVLVVEKTSGRVLHTVNYVSGLPDDEVFALGSDRQGGIWISHQYGLTRADLELPAGNFSIYPGLRGNLNGMVSYNGRLYVSTSEGVFYLTEEKQYIVVEVEDSAEPGITLPGTTAREDAAGAEPAIAQEQDAETVRESPSERKGLLSRLFRRRQEAETARNIKAGKDTVVVRTIPEPAVEKAQPPVRQTQERRTVRRLKSVDHVFKKVSGLNEKCRNLVPTPGGILAATNRGLVVIRDFKASTIEDETYVYSISPGYEADTYWISTSYGYFMVSYKMGRWSVVNPDPLYRGVVYSAASTGKDTIWLGTDNGVISVHLSEKPVYTNYAIKSDYPQRYLVDVVNDTLFVFAETGIHFYNRESDQIQLYREFRSTGGRRDGYVVSQPGNPWVFSDEEWLPLNQEARVAQKDRSLLKIFDGITALYTEINSLWVICESNFIYRIKRDAPDTPPSGLNLFIRSISNENGEYFNLDNVLFGSRENYIYFELSSPSYIKQNSVQYQYTVDRLMQDWSKWSTSSVVNLMLQPGKYTLRVRARDLWGNTSDTSTVNFTIETPFTRTAFFYFLMSVIMIILIAGTIKFRERRLRAEKRVLEERVRERTAEIEAQKEEITSSIEYASRIQNAMLPYEEHFKAVSEDYFLLFRPRDIVSGDFYWMAEDEKNTYFTVADCTGHGVPGAFMSTLGISALNEIVANNNELNAGEVLDLLRKKVMDSLHQTGKEGEAADGMDISFCILSKNRKLLQYAGAFNPIIVVSNGVITEYKADRMPIGIHIGGESSFTNFSLNVSKGDLIYLFTDGITDQFGGPDGKKFKKTNFRKLISKINHLPMPEQKKLIETEYLGWKGNLPQVDDITILAFRL